MQKASSRSWRPLFLRRKLGCLRLKRNPLQWRDKSDAWNIKSVQLLIVGDEQVYA
jgi:hypothetical protein